MFYDLLARKVSDENRLPKIDRFSDVRLGWRGPTDGGFEAGGGTFDGTLHCLGGRNISMAGWRLACASSEKGVDT